MGLLTECDLKQMVLVKNKISVFGGDKLDLFELVCDLDGLLNMLESVLGSQEDDFQAEINTLEVIRDNSYISTTQLDS